ncbi:hypothetical protein K5V21_16940 [Clostridium sardiniense]|uniref:Uncharacterized protein n=1 Tax=Clostridium sardiniense TaxID=29369 RepID=A0ABS7L2J3_CLOSR|nr:hypothetical protein [Clostridium sardiniense]MBY0757122.1 hypothetical protein [Clostridium sardiniense]MDQ0461420.1 hypothetical protein [Clostridium sardiniense]
MFSNKLTHILSVIEIIGLISMIFIHNNVIRIAIFVLLMPIFLINGQIKKQLYAEERKANSNKKSDDKKIKK